MDKKVIYLSLVVIIVFAMSSTAFITEAPRETREKDGNIDLPGGGESLPDGGNDSLIAQPAQMIDGSSGTISIPMVGASVLETDVKHHWEMPEGIVKLGTTLTWSSGWELEYSTGTGECPHSGEMLAVDTSSSGSITIVYEADEGDTLVTGTWFVHAAVPDINAHRGESMDYTMEVTIFSLPATE